MPATGCAASYGRKCDVKVLLNRNQSGFFFFFFFFFELTFIVLSRQLPDMYLKTRLRPVYISYYRPSTEPHAGVTLSTLKSDILPLWAIHPVLWQGPPAGI